MGNSPSMRLRWLDIRLFQGFCVFMDQGGVEDSRETKCFHGTKRVILIILPARVPTKEVEISMGRTTYINGAKPLISILYCLF